MEFLNQILQIVAAFVGFPAFLAAAINIAKYFGLPDGLAGTVNLVAHLLVYVGVGVAVLLGWVDILPGVDIALGSIANLLIALLALLSSLGLAKGFHGALRGVPVVGFSHSR